MKSVLFTVLALIVTSGCLKNNSVKKVSKDKKTDWSQESLSALATKIESSGSGIFKFDIMKKIKKTPEMKSFFIQSPHSQSEALTGQVAKNAYGSLVGDFLFMGNKSNESSEKLKDLTNLFCGNVQNPRVLQFRGYDKDTHKTAENHKLDIILETAKYDSKKLKTLENCVNKLADFKASTQAQERKGLSLKDNTYSEITTKKCPTIQIGLSNKTIAFLTEKRNRNKSDLFFECFLDF